MMKTRMSAFLLFGLALTTLALAQAATPRLAYDDSGFDYTTTGVQTAYLALGYDAGTLMLTLSSSPLGGQLPAIDVNNHPRLDSTGSVIAELTDLTTGISVDAPLGNRNDIQTIGITYTDLDTDNASDHNTDYRQIISSYDAALTKLGFKSQTELDTGSTLVKSYSQGGDTLRVTYNRDSLLQTSVHIALPSAA